MLTETGRITLSEEISTESGWFNFSKNTLLPILNQRNKILFKARQEDNSEELKELCRDAKVSARIAVEAAKCRWNEHLASSIANMRTTLKDS